MHKNLIIDAFEKARHDLVKEGHNKPSKVAISEKLSDYISEHTKTELGERRFRDYYDHALELNSDKGKDIKIQQYEIVSGLCNYLGYGNYEDYKSNKKKRSYKIFFYIAGIIGILVLSLALFNSESNCWMEWKDDHYEIIDFDTQKFNDGTLKLCKEDRLEHFKKVNVGCSTSFFDLKGHVKIWYGKNRHKELEYFSAYGLHPETGKTLKPITEYMIKTHICESY
ncbi:hypothetical protein [Aestuariivivens sediminis]|uniref:hypothetical protein n=1 Tax=Aestuariivivens sediminis TaxID=2913557 RepID=UPI001F5A8881|nr:hypothetical protein [Aestuariivivens sediminis]